jgi:hypothetical protein
METGEQKNPEKPAKLLEPRLFQERSTMSKKGTIQQLFQLLIERKAWWLVPMVTVFLVIGLLIVLTAGSSLSPFIYALF